MQGGYGEQEISLEDKKNILNAEIAELERRKGNLSKETESYYREYKNRLDLDYNIKVKKIEKDNSQKETESKRNEENFVKRKAFLDNQISTGEAQIKTALELAQKKSAEAVAAGNRYAELSENLKIEYNGKYKLLEEELFKIKQEREELSKEKAIIKNIQDGLVALEKQNHETQRRLDSALRDVESRQSYLIYWEGEIEKKEKENISLKVILDNQKIDLNNRESKIEEVEKETKKLFNRAEQLDKENKKKQESLDLQITDLKKQGENLASWRDELNETQLTLSEKDKYYVIREREIDAKIRILKALREEGGK
jgi:chromosome segregation ATPase